jgi:hypothetical protein
MKRNLIFIPFILSIGLPCVARQPVIPDGLSQAETATLDVSAEVDSLPVFLDNQRIGATPLKGMLIETGPHELAVQSPFGPVWNQPHYTSSFVAVPDRNYRFFAEFEKKISISSHPYGARVYRDTTLIGTTPLSVSSDVKKVLIIHPGYKPYELDLGAIENLAFFVNLQPREEWILSQKKSERIFKNRQKNRQKMMFISMGFSAIAGLFTIHFRSEGNEEYSRYLQTGVPSEMDHYYQKAQDYDRLAGLSYALFELGFVLTGYYFLTSRGANGNDL